MLYTHQGACASGLWEPRATADQQGSAPTACEHPCCQNPANQAARRQLCELRFFALGAVFRARIGKVILALAASNKSGLSRPDLELFGGCEFGSIWIDREEFACGDPGGGMRPAVLEVFDCRSLHYETPKSRNGRPARHGALDLPTRQRTIDLRKADCIPDNTRAT